MHEDSVRVGRFGPRFSAVRVAAADLRRDGLPAFLEEPVTVRDRDLEAVSGAATFRAAVVPCRGDESLACHVSGHSEPGLVSLQN